MKIIMVIIGLFFMSAPVFAKRTVADCYQKEVNRPIIVSARFNKGRAIVLNFKVPFKAGECETLVDNGSLKDHFDIKAYPFGSGRSKSGGFLIDNDKNVFVKDDNGEKYFLGIIGSCSAFDDVYDWEADSSCAVHLSGVQLVFDYHFYIRTGIWTGLFPLTRSKTFASLSLMNYLGQIVKLEQKRRAWPHDESNAAADFDQFSVRIRHY